MRALLDRYRDRLPVATTTPIISLGEGGTPLVAAAVVGEMLERKVFLKVEGANPTGSFKDRGMTLAISKAVEEGAKAVVCASTGNTSASAAAYAARAGIQCIVVLPAGQVAAGKLAQAIVHGAKVVAIDGNFDAALELVRRLADQYPVAVVNSINPNRLLGQQTAAWEIVEELGEPPALHALPVGNGGNITAAWMGYRELGVTPRMWGLQAAGAAPLVLGEPIEKPETVATAIRIGNPASWGGVMEARDASSGMIAVVTDAEILSAQRLLAEREGVFCEPASAASVAGLIRYRDKLTSGTLVCTLTGNGLKDTVTPLIGRELPQSVPAELGAVINALGW